MAKKSSRSAAPKVAFSNLDKIFFPKTGFTKGDMVKYYIDVAEYILPHLKNRPVSMVRFPDGVEGERFYEKNAPSFAPAWIKTFGVARKSQAGEINYILINDAPALAWCANIGELEKRFFSLMPMGQLTHRWSGQVVETVDGLPYIGLMAKDQFMGTGFGGNGMTFGTLTGMMALDAVQGRENRWSKLFDVHRKKWSGAWTYVKENKDYPLHLVHDWFSKGDRDSIASLGCESGRVFQIDGKRAAVFRKSDGNYNICSAICPHMGCTVGWNEAEKTWDCPCHGSRFRATGEVITGPAEQALEKLAIPRVG